MAHLVRQIFSKRFFSRSSRVCISIYEPNRRGGPYSETDKTISEHIINGAKIFREECGKFWEEVKEHFKDDPKIHLHGDSDVFFDFRTKDCLQQWITSSDKVNKEGESVCQLDWSDSGVALFHGNIDTTPPNDGERRYSGYCAIRSVRKMKSFLRESDWEWSAFTHLELRVRGDGRAYAINLGLNMYYDVNWFDTYTYPMFTRGGPYWETIRIPFSKFFLQSKGRVQDDQFPIPKDRIASVGIVAATVPGPFHLEIESIGCHVDDEHKEETAYELYLYPKEAVSA